LVSYIDGRISSDGPVEDQLGPPPAAMQPAVQGSAAA